MAKPTCVACKGAGGGVTPVQVQTMINTSIAGKQDVLTAGDGIEISENVISAIDSGYSIYDKTDWSIFVNEGKTTKDIILKIIPQLGNSGIFYNIPKGSTISKLGSYIMYPDTPSLNQINYHNYSIYIVNSFTNASSILYNVTTLYISSAEGGIFTINGLYEAQYLTKRTSEGSQNNSIYLYVRD